MAYDYKKRLGSDDLRLLQPVSISHRGLHFRVIAGPRRHIPDYVAISYTWGSDEATETIWLDGKKSFWADAICINQDDPQERNSQVRQMDKTYRDAEFVAVWLGLPPIEPELLTLIPGGQSMKTLQVDLDWAANMDDLASRPYWSRYWVIQEMLLGREVLVFCGNSAMHWQGLQFMLCQNGDVDQNESGTREWTTHRYAALPLIMGRHPDRHPEFQETLRTLLLRHRHSQCGDPRDRVFALLGLVTLEERNLLLRVFPDYTMSEKDVLILTLAHLLHTSALLCEPLDENQEELSAMFLALQVSDTEKRNMLLRRAKRIDYLGITSPQDAKSWLATDDFEAIGHNGLLSENDRARMQAYERFWSKHRITVSDSYGTFSLDGWEVFHQEARRDVNYGWPMSVKFIIMVATGTAGYFCWRRYL